MILTIAKIIIAALALLLAFGLGYIQGSKDEHYLLLKVHDKFQETTLKMVQDYEKVQKEKEEKDD
jgi:hypothetical protein